MIKIAEKYGYVCLSSEIRSERNEKSSRKRRKKPTTLFSFPGYICNSYCPRKKIEMNVPDDEQQQQQQQQRRLVKNDLFTLHQLHVLLFLSRFEKLVTSYDFSWKEEAFRGKRVEFDKFQLFCCCLSVENISDKFRLPCKSEVDNYALVRPIRSKCVPVNLPAGDSCLVWPLHITSTDANMSDPAPSTSRLIQHRMR
ncbi:hypothetical protein F2P81_012169 [Scophthalmus maximus]|uniref:Uncharacterized protein n=1 Tax=Scophthalmus maximus TaxID=52904 RepID=A0A6A4STP8_SCOMX|nr:hypothetical protein F2P81_012169 [Scophthalmus maximus]